MKKGLFGLLTLIVGIIVLFLFTACGDDNGDDNDKNTPTTYVDPALIGEWETSNGALTVDFTSTGITWGGSIGNHLNISGAVWTARDGEISYQYSGTKTVAYNYSISGSTLTLTNPLTNQNYLLTKDGDLPPTTYVDPTLIGYWETGNKALTVEFTENGITWGGSVGNVLNISGAVWTARDSKIEYENSGSKTTAYNYSISGSTLTLTNPLSSTSYTLTKESDSSDEELLAPSDITATANSASSITVSWNSVAAATDYRVYRSTTSNGTYTQVGTSTTSSFTDTGLTGNTTYYYRVSSVGSDGAESSQSNSVSATTDSDTPFNYADGSANIGRVGPGGGIVYYYNSSGFTVEGYTGAQGSFSTYTAHYLEVASSNHTNTVQWGDNGTGVEGITTFSSISPVSSVDANRIGNGRRDSQIISAHMAGKSITNTAAQVALDSTFGGQNDWFLPSLGELYLYYQSNVIGKPTTGLFWSSSQGSGDYSWAVNFGIGSGGNDGCDKRDDLNVRAVRAF